MAMVSAVQVLILIYHFIKGFLTFLVANESEYVLLFTVTLLLLLLSLTIWVKINWSCSKID